jgi:integrase
LETAKSRLGEYLKKSDAVQPTKKPPQNPADPYLWRHSDSGVYYIIFRRVDGKRTRKTCGTKNEGEAKAIFDRYLAELARPERPIDITVREILRGYLTDHSPNVASPNSLRHSVNALIANMGNLYPHQLSDARLRQFAHARMAKGRKAGTVARDVQILRAALRWALRQSPKWIDAEPIFRMPVKQTPPRDRWLTRDEADALINACQANHIRLFILLALHTTKRTGAILSLKWADIKDGIICFGTGSGNKRRGDVPINDTLAKALSEAKMLATTPYVIEYGGGRVLSIKTGFKNACQRAGIANVTPHTLRHTSASWMAMAGIPMAEIARVLGNSEAICERVYAKHSPSHMRRAVAALEAA